MAHGEISPLDLPRSMPHGYGNRLFLYTMRRMASAGVNDAHAANAMLGAFGRSYRRPLVLMRAMMLEVARCATRRPKRTAISAARWTSTQAPEPPQPSPRCRRSHPPARCASSARKG